jgi:predicted MFS family arabinose efflux permease
VHGGSARVVGIPLTLAALGWAAGSWWQGHGSADRSLLLPAGYALVAAAVASLIAVDISGTSLWLAAPIWLVAGAGIGIAITVLSVLVLELSPPEEQGANSAAFQICDIVGTTSGIAAVGALITGFGLRHLTTATVIADAGLAAVAALGVLATRRAGLARD